MEQNAKNVILLVVNARYVCIVIKMDTPMGNRPAKREHPRHSQTIKRPRWESQPF